MMLKPKEETRLNPNIVAKFLRASKPALDFAKGFGQRFKKAICCGDHVPEPKLTRRLVLSTGLVAAAGIALAGCGDRVQLETSGDGAFAFFTEAQAALLLDVAEIMIPATETVGATDTQTVLFLDQLMLTWASAATQEEIVAFVESLDAIAQSTHQRAYLDLDNDTRRALLDRIDQASFSSTEDSAALPFYRRVKWLIFHIHYSSEAANPDFVLIPGQYLGDVSEPDYLALVEDNRY